MFKNIVNNVVNSPLTNKEFFGDVNYVLLIQFLSQRDFMKAKKNIIKNLINPELEIYWYLLVGNENIENILQSDILKD